MNRQTVVTDLYIYEKKGASESPVSQVKCQKEQGIIGDIHATGGARQVTLQRKELKDWIEQEQQKGLCFEKFKGNIVVEGLCLEALKADSILRIGQVRLKITGSTKGCYPKECDIFKEKETCRILQECAFAMVLDSGNIAIGDGVQILNK